MTTANPDFRFQPRIGRDPCSGFLLDMVLLASLRSDPAKRACGVVTFTEADATRILPADCHTYLDEGAAQALADDLWNAGVRPRGAAGSAGQLDAVAAHLADTKALLARFASGELRTASDTRDEALRIALEQVARQSETIKVLERRALDLDDQRIRENQAADGAVAKLKLQVRECEDQLERLAGRAEQRAEHARYEGQEEAAKERDRYARLQSMLASVRYAARKPNGPARKVLTQIAQMVDAVLDPEGGVR